MDWNHAAATWDEREDVRAYASAAFESLHRQCEQLGFVLGGARVCDFGCGTGALSERLAGICKTVIALDTSPQMIASLQSKLTRHGQDHIVPIAAEVTSVLIRDHAQFQTEFDLITCSSVCAFLDDCAGTVKLLAGCLRPGGLFVQWDWEWNPDDVEPFGLTKQRIREAHAAAGLESVFVDTGFSITHDGETMSPLMGIGRRPVS